MATKRVTERSAFGYHNWTPGPLLVRSTFCVTGLLCMCLSVWSKAHYQLLTSSNRDGGLTGLSIPVFCSSVVCTLCTLQNKATALICAAEGGHTDVIQVLLSRQDVDINVRDEVC